MTARGRLARTGGQDRALRAVVLASGLAFLVLVPVAGGEVHPFLTAAAVPLVALVALSPGSNAGLGLLVYLGSLWALAVPAALGPATLTAAVDLCVLHTACTLASYGPPGVVLDRRILAVWRGRWVLCVAAAVMVWSFARVLGFLDLPASGFALALALVVLLGWLGFLSARLVRTGVAEDPRESTVHM